MVQTRFDALKAKLASKPDVTDPAALAAKIGRAKLGRKAFAKRAAVGRSRAAKGLGPAKESIAPKK